MSARGASSGPTVDQDKSMSKTSMFDVINSAAAELEAIEDLLGIAQDEKAEKEGSAPDVPDRLALSVRLILNLGNRLAEAKNALLGMKKVLA